MFLNDIGLYAFILKTLSSVQQVKHVFLNKQVLLISVDCFFYYSSNISYCSYLWFDEPLLLCAVLLYHLICSYAESIKKHETIDRYYSDHYFFFHSRNVWHALARSRGVYLFSEERLPV